MRLCSILYLWVGSCNEKRAIRVARASLRLIAVVLALLLIAVVIWASGYSPLELAKKIIHSAFGTAFGRQQFFALAAPHPQWCGLLACRSSATI